MQEEYLPPEGYAFTGRSAVCKIRPLAEEGCEEWVSAVSRDMPLQVMTVDGECRLIMKSSVRRIRRYAVSQGMRTNLRMVCKGQPKGVTTSRSAGSLRDGDRPFACAGNTPDTGGRQKCGETIRNCPDTGERWKTIETIRYHGYLLYWREVAV